MGDELLVVRMPHMGVSVTEATVVGWHFAPGDAVAAEEPICDVTTDKVDTEVPAPAAGVLARILAAEGDTVGVGEPLAELSVAGAPAGPASPASPGVAEVAAPAAEPRPPPVAAAPRADTAAATLEPRRFDAAAAAAAVVSRAHRDGGPLSSPVARRCADQHGIDLATVRGSGRRGRIRLADVLAALEDRPQGPASADLPRGYEDVPFEIAATTRRRRMIAEHMIRSRQTAAHMTTEAEVDTTAAAAARDELNAARAAAGRGRVSYLALITRVACAALAEFPDLNATFEHERVIRWREINMGIAVDTEAGLMVPVIRGCERLTATAIADAIAVLAQRARGGTLSPDDVRAGTFTISNPGSAGGYSAMAIINQPQVAILGTPVIVRRPTVVSDEHGTEAIGIRPIMTLALTFDHRAVDGAQATRCVVRIKQLLESWRTADYA